MQQRYPLDAAIGAAESMKPEEIEKLTDEEKRVKIAEACGWVWYRLPQSNANAGRSYRSLFLPAIHEHEGQSEKWMIRADGTERVASMAYMEANGYVPDYLNGLNAICEATQRSLHNQFFFLEYQRNLWAVVTGREWDDKIDYKWSLTMFEVTNATARQRAEAFLRTI